MNTERIDIYYNWFAEARPEIVAKELDTKYVYIHRINASEPVGAATQVRIKDPLHRNCSYVGYPPLENWLMNHFHPQIKMTTSRTQRNRLDIRGSLELFDVSVASAPGLFDDPQCSMIEVYHCAAAFTYDMLYNGKGPALSKIDHLVDKAITRNESLEKLEEDASLIIDIYITQTYKSLIKMSQALTRYVRMKV